tara:strand:- start:783 stop:983 length:201 start_codon:yes stop_codon:yes gene_type:complete
MNIASIYPNGVEKGRNSVTGTGTNNPELKRKVLAMLERGIKIVRVCEKYNIDKATVFYWQEAKERY